MLLEHCVISMSISTNCTLISMVYLQVVFLLHIGLWIILQSSVIGIGDGIGIRIGIGIGNGMGGATMLVGERHHGQRGGAAYFYI